MCLHKSDRCVPQFLHKDDAQATLFCVGTQPAMFSNNSALRINPSIFGKGWGEEHMMTKIEPS